MSRYFMCPICGSRMSREKDIFGNWDGESYICEKCRTNELIEEEDEDDEDYEGEYISVHDAALIWLSHGKDPDYTFGYSEEELEDALDD